MKLRNMQIVASAALLAGAFAQTATAAEPGKPQWTVVASGRMDVTAVKDGRPVFALHTTLCGAGWTQSKTTGMPVVDKAGHRVYEQKQTGFYDQWWQNEPSLPGRFDLRYELSQADEKTIRIRQEMTPDTEMSFGFPSTSREAPSATLATVLQKEVWFKGGSARIIHADGRQVDVAMPIARGGYDQVRGVELKTKAGALTRLTFDPPLFIHCDNDEMRCMSGTEKGAIRKAGEVFKQEILVQMAEPFAFEPMNRWVDTANWFEFENVNDFSDGSPIGMAGWMDKPAGKRGWLRAEGKSLIFADGTPVKFWGGNTCHSYVMQEPAAARQWAQRYAKYGNNIIRLHKWTHSGDTPWDGGVLSKADHTVLDEERMKKFDCFHSELKAHGVYASWSHIYNYQLSPADRDRLTHYDEIVKLVGEKGSMVGLVNFIPEIQDLFIKVTTNLLNHKNAQTGLRYADDPALAIIEMRNEDCIFFWGYDSYIQKCPSYSKALNQRYAKWLAKEYGSLDAAAKAWGGLGQGESLEAGVSPWVGYYYQSLPLERRVADSYRFLFDAQNDFYQRYAKAIRDTGYQGVLVGSCWQAHTFIGHLWNVYSDGLVGAIDRHNYASTAMNQPGVGLMSCFLQAAEDRPFGFSEWMGGDRYGCVVDMPMVALYGLGLQGWDYSQSFAEDRCDIPNFLGGMGQQCNRLPATAQYPALLRMLHRGDIKEGEVVARRTVSLPALRKGDPGFTEEFNLLGGANNKEFKAVAPSEALAAGRVVLAFTENAVAAPVKIDLGKLIDEQNKIVTSSSGQLRWHYGGQGYFTADTPASKAVVGYAGGVRHELTDVVIETENPFAIIYVTALEKDKSIRNSKQILITAMARMVDKGALFEDFASGPVQDPNANKGPLIIEPVMATVTIRGKAAGRVSVLDHEGRRRPGAAAAPTRQEKGGMVISVDGTKSKAFYYLVEMQ